MLRTKQQLLQTLPDLLIMGAMELDDFGGQLHRSGHVQQTRGVRLKQVRQRVHLPGEMCVSGQDNVSNPRGHIKPLIAQEPQ